MLEWKPDQHRQRWRPKIRLEDQIMEDVKKKSGEK